MLAACNDEEEFTCRLQSFEISAVTTTTATLTAVIDASDMEAVDQMGFCVRRTSDVDFEWIAIPKSRTIICRLDDLAEGATYECRAFVRAVGESWTFPVERFTTQKGGGSDPDPDPNPDPDPDPTPDPDPDPNPDPDPDPTPDPDGPVYRTGWFELPVENDADGDGRDDKNPTYYYAHHLCAGNESNAQDNGSARNFSVCYSSEHHCPVWVAAPRHKCYSGSANRTNAYGQDPQIPSDIQYYSKSTGGGCNKGHMVGSAERTSSSATNRQVFYYTNIAPQNMSTFNTGGGAWNNLEDHIDGLVCADTLYEVVGCYFDSYTDAYGSAPHRVRRPQRREQAHDVLLCAAAHQARQHQKVGQRMFGRRVAVCGIRHQPHHGEGTQAAGQGYDLGRGIGETYGFYLLPQRAQRPEEDFHTVGLAVIEPRRSVATVA